MQFHLIVVSIFLKTCVKDHGDSFSRLLERRVLLVCIEALLLAVFVNIFRASDRLRQKMGNSAAFLREIMRQERPIMRQIMRFF